MPIYEFYCKECNTIYKFYSRTVNTEKIPFCPTCKDVKLERRMSLFATISANRDEGGEEDGMPPIDESKMEKVMSKLAKQVDKIDEEDPRQAAQLMRELTDATGLKLGPGMEEALRRLEKGEDPEKIEEEMGDLLEEEEPFILEGKKSSSVSKPTPRVDEKLYEL